MSIETADFMVIGAGIAGASLAYELSRRGKVIVVEAETAPGYHSTGRSAAIMSENYGPPLWSRLVTASRRFLETPPDRFSDTGLVSPRGAMFLARDGEEAQLAAQAAELRRRGAKFEALAAQDALRFCPVIRADAFAGALYEPDCLDIDTHALLSAYLRALKARGGRLVTGSRVTALRRNSGIWQVTAGAVEYQAPVIANAAGGWAQHIARLAGLPHRAVVPYRRTAILFDPPAGSAIATWPMTFDVAETFYFKPEAGKVMVSPVDMAASEPCDAQADELEVAIAVDRIQRCTTMEVRRIDHKWGGLRTFAPDHEPVIGPDPQAPGFIWLAGQGGNGVMGAPAAARLAASLALGEAIPHDLAALGLTAESVSPGRASVIGEQSRRP